AVRGAACVQRLLDTIPNPPEHQRTGERLGPTLRPTVADAFLGFWPAMETVGFGDRISRCAPGEGERGVAVDLFIRGYKKDRKGLLELLEAIDRLDPDDQTEIWKRVRWLCEDILPWEERAFGSLPVPVPHIPPSGSLPARAEESAGSNPGPGSSV